MLKVNTQISSASIFRNGAEIIRKGTAELAAGKQTLQITGFSSTAVRDTVRVFSAEGIRCSNIRFDTTDDGNKESDKIREEIAIENRKIESINLQITLWQNNGDFSSRTSVNNADIEQYIDKLPERIARLDEEIRKSNEKIKELNKKLDEACRAEAGPIVTVDVFSENAATVPIELRYHDSAACWQPIYEIQTDGKETFELLMKATMLQNTNEDWKDLNVSLYTGDPSADEVLPQIDPRYLSIRTAVNNNLFKAKGAARNEMMGMRMAAPGAYEDMEMEDTMVKEEAAPVRLNMVTADLNQEDTMSEYILPDKKDLYRGQEAVADLEHHDIAAVFKTVSVPKKDPHAYLVATIHSNDLPVKEAVSAGIYLKDVYTGDIDLDPDLNEEETDISLGRQERIFVKYKLASKKNSSALLKGLKITEYVYETDITNGTDNKTDVIIKDQIPVSQDKTITVELTDKGGYRLEEETGFLNQTVALEPSDSVKVRFAYKVSWPKDKNIAESSGKR